MIKWSWIKEARAVKPRRTINPRLMELETAKQILEEIFHARPSDVDVMTQRRLGEEVGRRELALIILFHVPPKQSNSNSFQTQIRIC